jgi:hypothetical protein
MKNLQLKAALAAFAMTMLFFTTFGQGEMFGSHYDNIEPLKVTYVTVYGGVYNSEAKRDKIEISLYVLEDDCTWTLMERLKDNNYMFALERDQEYQIWFNDLNETKIMYIDPGYQGNYAYEIDANFITTKCVRLTPKGETKAKYDVNIVTYSELIPLIYAQVITD